MKDPLRVASFSRLKQNTSSYILVSVMCGLFLILAATLAFLDVLLFVLVIPLIVLPILFASHIACYYLEANQPITVSAIFRYYAGFYRPQFRGSFRGIRAFLLSLAFYFGGMVICYVVFYSIFQQLYGATFAESFSNLAKTYMLEEMTYEDLIAILNDNDGMLLTFFSYVSSMPLALAIPWFIYSITSSSISVYYRSNIVTPSTSLIRLAINNTFLKIKKAYYRDWFSLNWPIIALSLLGATTGILLTILLFKNVAYLGASICVGSVLFVMFFLPFYFSNMEVLYHRYEPYFKDGNKAAVEMILRRIQNSIELSEEEREELEKSFNNDGEEEK
jgi:hypothetical protein